MPSAAQGDASNTASFKVTGSGQLTIAGLADAAGAPLLVVPAGLAINPSANGAPTTTTLTGTGMLTFSGVFTASGAGTLGANVNLASDVSGQAVPGGVADGLETAAGGIQFINNSGAPVQVTMSFTANTSAMGSVTDPVLETVSNVLYDVEFSETLGGDPASPCVGGILLDQQMFGLGAPPDFSVAPLVTPAMRMATIPNGSTCSFNVLVQTGGRAVATAPVPFLSPPLLVAFALLVLLVGFVIVRRGERARLRHG